MGTKWIKSREKIKKLEQNQKPKIYPKRGVIYVFETPNSPQNSLYKIGKTKDLKQRLKSHQSPLSHDINILYYFETEDIDSVEKCAKTFMKKYQYRKYKDERKRLIIQSWPIFPFERSSRNEQLTKFIKKWKKKYNSREFM